MTGYAERIRRLREQTGKTDTEMAELLGMSLDSYCDLEMYDDELTTVPSVKQVRMLADILGVSMVRLLAEENLPPDSIEKINYEDLVRRTKEYIDVNCANQDEFEDQIGWYLADLFAGQESAWETYSIQFLQDLCRRLSLSWLETLPA